MVVVGVGFGIVDVDFCSYYIALLNFVEIHLCVYIYMRVRVFHECIVKTLSSFVLIF